MNFLTKILFYVLLCFSIYTTAYAAEGFVVSGIRVEGLQRIQRETVLNYLPVKVGEEINPSQTSEMLQKLYDTGFFKDVSVSRQGNVLLIRVVEYPTIGKINIVGKIDIDKEKFDELLKQQGLVEGHVFNPALLEKVRSALLSEYKNRGQHNASVTASVKDQERNRVEVTIDVSQGGVAVVRELGVVGNTAFKSKKLIKEMVLSTPGIITFFTRTHQFNQEKLDQSLEILRSYYMDRGYINFKIESTDVKYSPDHKDVTIYIHVHEGCVYTIKSVELSGETILPAEQLNRLIVIKPGQVFSRDSTLRSVRAITRALANQGYAFANVNAVPNIDEANRQVSITFYIEPGNRVYVRRIKFAGNFHTNDKTLRRQLLQYEASPVSWNRINRSLRRLRRLEYLQAADVTTLPIPGVSDQIDLEYKVQEAQPASATASMSYGTDGIGYGLSMNNNNFLGTGNTLTLMFDKRPIVRTFNLNYLDPYHTVDGVQRGFTAYAQRYTPGAVNVTNYTYNNYGASVYYSIPISIRDDYIQYGIGYERTLLSIGQTPSFELRSFVRNNGTQFSHLLLNAGWKRSTLDRVVFPNCGLIQNLTVNVWVPAGSVGSSKTIGYYKAMYNNHYYYPLPINRSFIFTASSAVGYGDGFGRSSSLPFFQNYFSGGIGYLGAVRGYETNSIGPRDSMGNPLGGNFMVAGNLSMIFPNPVSSEKLRTGVFIDAGNVYNTRAGSVPIVGRSNPHSGPVRLSAGIAADWKMPIFGAILSFSLAKPLNQRNGDLIAIPQFNMGASF